MDLLSTQHKLLFLIVGQLLSPIFSQLNFSANFLHNFAKQHRRLSIVLHNKNKNVFFLKGLFSELPINVAQNASFKSGSDLHLFIPNKSENISKSIADFKLMFKEQSKNQVWLLDASTIKNPEADLQDLQVDLDDDLYWFKGNASHGEIFEAYKVNQFMKLQVNKYGTWSHSQLTIPNVEKWSRRKNLKGTHLRVLSVKNSPYTTEMTPLKNSSDSWSFKGMYPDILDALQQELNFTFSVKQPKDQKWGSLQSDGSFSGMIGLLASGQADFACSAFTVTLERSEAVSFTTAINIIHHRLFIKNPEGALNLSAFFAPLQTTTWLAVIAFCLLMPFIMFISFRFSPADDLEKQEFTLTRMFVATLSFITMKGWSDEPRGNAAKLTFLVVITASMLLYWFWEAMLVSYLSMRVIILPFRSLDELLAKSNYYVGINVGSQIEDTFKLSRNPVFQRIWTERIVPKYEVNSQYSHPMIMLTENPTMAYYGNFYSSRTHELYKSCEIVTIPAKYQYEALAMAMQKNSPFSDLINYQLSIFLENGVLNQIRKKYEPQPQVCPDYSGQPLGFGSVLAAFIPLIVSTFISLCLFVIECISGKFMRAYFQ